MSVTKTEPNSAYDYLQIPSVLYAVFDIDHKTDQGKQFEQMHSWLDGNTNEYKRFAWDAGGLIPKLDFMICAYDHRQSRKFNSNQVMEVWIPLVKV